MGVAACSYRARKICSIWELLYKEKPSYKVRPMLAGVPHTIGTSVKE